MTTSVGTIIDSIYTILSGVTGIDQHLKYLPRYIDKNVTSAIYYDEARFEPAEINSQWAYYKIQIILFIYMYDESTLQSDQITLGDAVMDALRASPSLGGSCQGFTITGLKNDYVQTANGNVYGTVEINLEVRKEEDI